MIQRIWEPMLQKGFEILSGFEFPVSLEICFPVTSQFLVILGERKGGNSDSSPDIATDSLLTLLYGLEGVIQLSRAVFISFLTHGYSNGYRNIFFTKSLRELNKIQLILIWV